MTARVFHNDVYERAFKGRGYAVVPVADPKDLSVLDELYRSLDTHRDEHRFFTTIWIGDRALRDRVNRAIGAFIYPRVKDLLADYVPVFGNFMVKRPGERSSMLMHQDWTFVDESKFRTVNVWLPVTPITAENGPLKVVPHSHHFDRIIRGRNITSPFDGIYDGIHERFSQTIIPKPGEAVIFDNALMHASEDNATGRDRVAVSLVLKPRQAPLVHYAADGEGGKRAWKYHIDESFFVDYGLFDDLGALNDRQPVNLNQPSCPLWKFRLSHFVHKMTA